MPRSPLLLALVCACGPTDAATTDSATDAATTGSTTDSPTTTAADPACMTASATLARFTLDLGDWPASADGHMFDAPCRVTAAVQDLVPTEASFTLACTDAMGTERTASLALTGQPAVGYVDIRVDDELTLQVRRPPGAADDEGSFALRNPDAFKVGGSHGPAVGDPALFAPFAVSAEPQDCAAAPYQTCAAAHTYDLVIDGGPFSGSHFPHGHAGLEGTQVYLYVAIERALQVVSDDPASCPIDPAELASFRFLLTFSPL